MGTALVMEHANALAQMIVSEKDKLFDERVEALVKLYRRAEFYLKQGFLESIVCEFHRKKVEMIMQAETKGEITEILKLSKPHFDGKKFVVDILQSSGKTIITGLITYGVGTAINNAANAKVINVGGKWEAPKPQEKKKEKG